MGVRANMRCTKCRKPNAHPAWCIEAWWNDHTQRLYHDARFRWHASLASVLQTWLLMSIRRPQHRRLIRQGALAAICIPMRAHCKTRRTCRTMSASSRCRSIYSKKAGLRHSPAANMYHSGLPASESRTTVTMRTRTCATTCKLQVARVSSA